VTDDTALRDAERAVIEKALSAELKRDTLLHDAERAVIEAATAQALAFAVWDETAARPGGTFDDCVACEKVADAALARTHAAVAHLNTLTTPNQLPTQPQLGSATDGR